MSVLVSVHKTTTALADHIAQQRPRYCRCGIYVRSAAVLRLWRAKEIGAGCVTGRNHEKFDRHL